MSQWLGAVILVAGLLILIQLLGINKKSKDVVRIARHSLKIINSSKLSDEAKERRLQQNSTKLFSLFFILAFNGAIALGLPLGVLWIGDRLNLLSLSAVLDTTLSPGFLILSSILVLFFLGAKTNKQSHINSYSSLDRTLHHVAFKTYTAQIALADLEDTIFSKQLANCPIERPVFITALPRAGTTLLLECCANLPEFASHCYREMPFVLIPCLWNRFSQSFQRTVESQERAHGDGMQINPDSPEALEEVVWKTFWQKHYQSDRIIPWDIEEKEEFNEFFHSHLRKIILLRRQNPVNGSVRYISKNNANIARIPLLKRLFPQATIIVPFRHPLEHAHSLLQQHLNFLKIHQADHFASEYMQAIGHFDFGENLRPLDFGGWFDKSISSDTQSLSFWLEYWLVSYQYLLNENASLVNFFDYEALCNHPEVGLKCLAKAIACHHPDILMAAATSIRPPKPKEIDTSTVPPSLLKEANQVCDRLREMSINSK